MLKNVTYDARALSHCQVVMRTRFDDEGKAKNIAGHRDMLGRTSWLSESSLLFALARWRKT
jgi:hypothetical protein